MSTRGRASRVIHSPDPPQEQEISADPPPAPTSDTQCEDEVAELVHFGKCSISQEDQNTSRRQSISPSATGPSGLDPDLIIVDCDNPDAPGDDASSPISDFTDDPDVQRPHLRTEPPVDGFFANISRPPSRKNDSKDESTEPDTPPSETISDSVSISNEGRRGKPIEHLFDDDILMEDVSESVSASLTRAVSPSRFYATAAKKERKTRPPQPFPLEIHDKDEEEVNDMLQSSLSSPQDATT